MATQNRSLPSAASAKAATDRTILDIYDLPYQVQAFEPDIGGVSGSGGADGQLWTADGADGAAWENLDIASQAEAEAGTNNEKVITPLRMAQGIEALVSGGVFAYSPYYSLSGTNNSPQASAVKSIQIGYGANANGSGTIVVGKDSYDKVAGGVAIGDTVQNDWSGSLPSVGIGKGASANQGSIAIGGSPSASGVYSIAMGYSTSASGDRAVAIGQNLSNSVDDSVRIGVSASEHIAFDTWVVAAGVGIASTHTLALKVGGTTYKVLLSNV